MNKISHIALFLPSLAGGGAERVMVTLANGFVQKGLSVDLVLVKADGPYLKEVLPGVKVINLNASRTLFSLRALTKYLKKEKPQILFSTLDHANIVALWARMLSRCPAKCIIRLPNTISSSAHNSQNIRGKFIPWLIKYFIKQAEAVIAVSHASARYLITSLRIPADKIHVIYNPVICDALFEKAKEPLGHPWFTSGQPPVILGVGRLSKQKDFSTLIRAFALVHKEKPIRLMILGEGEERPALEKLISKLGIEKDVALPGFVENPFPYMKQASVFILSSRWEGLPNVLIQAIALGTPVVATNCPGGVAEILGKELSVNLVAVENEWELSRAITDTLSISQKAIWDRMSLFTEKNILQQYMALMEG